VAVAAFDGIDLLIKSGGGGIFEVPSGNGDSDFIYSLDDGGEVVLPANAHVAIVRGVAIIDCEVGLALAREAANRALDMSLAKGAPPAFLDHHKQPEVLWWHDSGGTTLRVLSTTGLTMKMSATVVVKDANGEIVTQPPPPEIPWHESMRYYRISEATNDLFDSFRNLYLAIEALLSTISPPIIDSTGQPEREGDWLKRALREVHAQLDLSSFAPTSRQAAHNAIFNDLYSGLRTAIFHAKRGKRVWLPQEWTDRQTIIEARQRYARLFRRLAEYQLGVRFPGSGLSKHGFAVTGAAIMENMVVFLSDDQTRHVDEPKGEYGIAPAGGRVLHLPTRPATELLDDWTTGVVGAESGDTITAAIGAIRRFGTLRGGELALVENLTGALDVSGADSVEVALLATNRNWGAPKQDFGS